MVRTYIDSGVLIYAAKGTATASTLALPFVTDPQREYVTSDYVRLEVLPKSKFNRMVAEASFYEAFFAANAMCIAPSTTLTNLAMEQAVKHGMSGMDALHVAAAVLAGAQELVTSEISTKPIHRTELIKVISIFPDVPARRKALARRLTHPLYRLAGFIERHMS